MLTRKIFISLFLIFSLVLIGFVTAHFVYGSKAYKEVGKEMFLGYHKNDPAIFFLNLSEKINRTENVPDYEIYFLLGRVLFVENRLKESIKNYSYAIEINPEHKESYYGRGLSYGFSSPIYLKDAENDFQKYIDLDNEEFKKSGHHAYGAWAGYNDLAWIYFLQGEFEKSVSTSKLGLEIAHDSPWLLNMLASSLISQNRCGEALPYLEKALTKSNQISVEEFGEAYSGDNRSLWSGGLANMQKTILENIELCNKK